MKNIKTIASAGIVMIGVLSLLFSGCQPRTQPLQPNITYVISQPKLERLPSAFEPLTPEEMLQDWAKELLIGDAFAREMDLYRAITAYKRALVLLPCELNERRLQIQYNIALCYYIANKFQDVINTFEEGELTEADPSFLAFNNLLIMLYDSYMKLNQCEKAEAIFQLIEKCSPETSRDLTIYSDIQQGDLINANDEVCCHPEGEKLAFYLSEYGLNAKSPKKAQFLNAILPGAGYYYVGQKKSALTSFIINTLFTAAAYQFFHHGYYAAGAITASIETGWYLGGINGAGLEAEEFNERLYEVVGHKLLADNGLFPILMFETAF